MPQCPGSAGCCVCRGSQSALIPLFPDPEKDVTPQDNLLSIRDGSKTTQTEDKACTSPTPMYKVCNTNISPFLLIFCTLRNSQKVWDTVSADRLCTLTDSVLPFISPVIHLNNTCCINFLNLAYSPQNCSIVYVTITCSSSIKFGLLAFLLVLTSMAWLSDQAS